MTGPPGRFRKPASWDRATKPFATGGNPALKRFSVEGIVTPGISDQRQQGRRELLGKLNTLEHVLTGNVRLAAFEEARETGL